MLALAQLVALAALSTPPATASPALRIGPVDACAASVSVSASVAEDLRSALDAHGGAVRWDPSRGPLRIWVQRRPEFAADVSKSAAEWRRTVFAATEAWQGVVPGLAFALASDSSRADVVVTWDRELAGTPASGELASSTAGRTTLVPSEDGRVVLAHVRLAVFAAGHVRYAVEDVRAVARHEFGHVLGLAHHAATSSIMAPLVRADGLTGEDRSTLRALYALPIGARCVTLGGEASR